MLRPTVSAGFAAHANTIIGNTVLYGATEGKLFAAGQAGERFAVRNSGATAVVEGCGSNGCEYMTGGSAVLLGPVGDNFAAGMTGGMAFVYDEDELFERHVNSDTVTWRRIGAAHWDGVLHALVAEHVREAGSEFGAEILANWAAERERFWQVIPNDMLAHLAQPLDESVTAPAGAPPDAARTRVS